MSTCRRNTNGQLTLHLRPDGPGPAVRRSQKTEGGYLASATPPHIHSDWRTPEACNRDDLIAELAQRGAHPTDIGDAFYAADQDWLDSKPT